VTAIDTSVRVDSPDISLMMNLQTSPLLNVQAPTFSPVGLPRPGKQADELWSSREVSFSMHVTGLCLLIFVEYSGNTQPPAIRFACSGSCSNSSFTLEQSASD